MQDNPKTRPRVTLLPGHDKRARHGHPWIYSNEIAMDAAAKALPPGTLVTVVTAEGTQVAAATFNPHTLIAARVLTREAGSHIHDEFIRRRVRRALDIRDRLFPRPFYRLIHAEADGLPGLVVDRYGDVLAVQLNTAGMAMLWPSVMEALQAIINPRAIVLRGDSSARTQEGLPLGVEMALGELDGPVEIEENGGRFSIDVMGGQKTGWFFDQRENRAWVSRLAQGSRVLDLYTYGGGFAVAAALAGASEVLAIDRSEPALANASTGARLSGVEGVCTFKRGEVFAELEGRAKGEELWDLVIADPPAFVKSRKDLASGTRGYRKLAKLSAQVTKPGGYLFIASCSHNVELSVFAEQVARGVADANRSARILRTGGAGPDHPVHPMLPESAYLKSLTLAID
ncbi:SAM-dependent methyltransferase [Stella humosa]|uniref:SAM-dependent methyltransferase n=1 Tax=Stella humosa TaxID=94 RepID=A0A3N1KY87_9PROT|nr:class I SAM-dependent rRNA methyltransferase [Stella humosa]ROP84402.1 SAM-dependent methyltransferase [Stella humosa]BBK33918.1 SAM-dependent methyltransferase [Stella humosa]